MGRLTGKTALITGGSSGIGLAAARLFRDEGALVAITGRNGERLEEAKQKLGNEVLAIPSEAGSLAEIDALMVQVKSNFKKLDVLFLNAAIAHPAPIDLVTEEQFDEVVAVNFKGIFFSIQKALPLLSDNASIILTTSIVNKTGSPYFSVYGATKAALRSLAQSLSLGLIERGIRINTICPGPIDTEGIRAATAHDPSITETIRCRSPMGRLGTSEEVAKVALFLASDESSYVVGEEIVVDGAITAVCLP